MSRSTLGAAAGFVLMLGLSACTNPYDPAQRAVGGGLIGAGTGAAIGAAAGGGAALGAAIGGAAGALGGIATTPPPPGYYPQAYYPPSPGYPPQAYYAPPPGYYPPPPPPPYYRERTCRQPTATQPPIRRVVARTVAPEA